jgi:hypothetical protein
VKAAPAIVKASSDQVRHGLIGAGSRGDYLLKHLRSTDNGHCVALCDSHPVPAIWYREPRPPSLTSAGEKKACLAGPTTVSANTSQGVPILLDRDKVGANASFVDREMKYARQWLCSKGVMMPEEPRNPVETELDSFLKDCRSGGRPRANIDVGLADSATVMATNMTLDEDRKVMFSEIEALANKAPKA